MAVRVDIILRTCCASASGSKRRQVVHTIRVPRLRRPRGGATWVLEAARVAKQAPPHLEVGADRSRGRVARCCRLLPAIRPAHHASARMLKAARVTKQAPPQPKVGARLRFVAVPRRRAVVPALRWFVPTGVVKAALSATLAPAVLLPVEAHFAPCRIDGVRVLEPAQRRRCSENG